VLPQKPSSMGSGLLDKLSIVLTEKMNENVVGWKFLEVEQWASEKAK